MKEIFKNLEDLFDYLFCITDIKNHKEPKRGMYCLL